MSQLCYIVNVMWQYCAIGALLYGCYPRHSQSGIIAGDVLPLEYQAQFLLESIGSTQLRSVNVLWMLCSSKEQDALRRCLVPEAPESEPQLSSVLQVC